MESFWRACKKGEFKAVINMLEMDKKFIRATDGKHGNWTCLHWAAEHCEPEAIKYITTTEGVDVDAKSTSGDTAFGVLLRKRSGSQLESVSFYARINEAIKSFVKVNKEIVNQCDTWTYSPLQWAVEYHNIEVVKLLVKLGCDVNHKNLLGHSALRISSLAMRIDCMRYLMNIKTCDKADRQSAFNVYMSKLFGVPNPTDEKIEFTGEMFQVAFESQVEVKETSVVLLDCFLAKIQAKCEHADSMFKAILETLLPDHPVKRFVEKILAAEITSNDCLIIMELARHMDLERTRWAEYYKRALREQSPRLFQELFELYLSDELFFNEYISKMQHHKSFDPYNMVLKFTSYLTEKKTKDFQQVFSFFQILVKNNLSYFDVMKDTLPWFSYIPVDMKKLIFQILVPLSNYVHSPCEVIRPRLIPSITQNFEVVSLKNQSRTAIRKYAFTTYSRSEALNYLYSADIPAHLKIFLCYNFCKYSYKTVQNLNDETGPPAKRKKM